MLPAVEQWGANEHDFYIVWLCRSPGNLLLYKWDQALIDDLPRNTFKMVLVSDTCVSLLHSRKHTSGVTLWFAGSLQLGEIMAQQWCDLVVQMLDLGLRGSSLKSLLRQ